MGDPVSLTRTIEELAVQVNRTAEPVPVDLLVRYANALINRYEAVGDPGDIDRALGVAELAVTNAGDARGARDCAQCGGDCPHGGLSGARSSH